MVRPILIVEPTTKAQVGSRGFAQVIARSRFCSLFAPPLALFLGLGLASSGCAHRMGSQTTSGALAQVEEHVEAEPGQRPSETIARRATRGIIGELSEPEQQQRIGEAMTNATDSFRGALTQGLIDDLGTDGDGPLAQSIVALAERSATRAAHGAMATVLAGCDPQNPSCLDHRVADLSTRAAVAFVDGVKHSLAIPALATAFLAGAATVLFLGALWRLLRRSGDSSDSRSGKRGRAPTAPPAMDTRAPASTSA
jgi:hypothetical protein